MHYVCPNCKQNKRIMVTTETLVHTVGVFNEFMEIEGTTEIGESLGDYEPNYVCMECEYAFDWPLELNEEEE